MACSLLAESVPAHAAGAGGGAPTPYDRPELVMDFLGDNKTGYNDSQPGSGYVQPKDTDQASADVYKRQVYCLTSVGLWVTAVMVVPPFRVTVTCLMR